tara:strand:- start:64 stop:357 length:294 start_codon:yes stop_codon:yes gene_type:complete
MKTQTINPENFTSQAFITLSNFGGIEIMFNRSNDGLFYRFNYGQDNLHTEEIFEAEILYSEEQEREGQSYFIHQSSGTNKPNIYSVYYLSEAMRTNY